MKSRLFIIGTGPGDPELLTLKAIRTIRECEVIVAPKGSPEGCSTALGIISQVVDLSTKQVHELHFPMKKVVSGSLPEPELAEAWKKAALTVIEALERGNQVAFPTLGDPAIYSTGYYLYETILSFRPETEIVFIPGIPAMSSCSAATATPICLGGEMVAVVPATFSDTRLKTVFEQFDTIVLMKVSRVMDRLRQLLTECRLLERAVLVEQAGTENQKVYPGLVGCGSAPHYFSTIIVRRNETGQLTRSAELVKKHAAAL